jgi:excisionase family DNA binding protein
MTQHDTDRDANMTHQDHNMTSSSTVRVTVEEAAKLLDVSVDAIRKRIERGTLRSEKVEKTRYVLLDGVMTHQDTDMTEHHDSDMTPLVVSMQDQIDTLKQELDDWKEEARRKDAILLTMAQRIPELEPAREDSPEPQRAPVSRSDNSGNGDLPPEEERREKSSWWRRLFEV